MIDAVVAQYTSVSYEVVATSIERCKPVNTQSSQLYTTMAKVIKEHNLIAQPLAFEATTDLRFYSARGIEGIGVTPFTIAANLHGVNEAIYTIDLVLAVSIFYSFLEQFCN